MNPAWPRQRRLICTNAARFVSVISYCVRRLFNDVNVIEFFFRLARFASCCNCGIGKKGRAWQVTNALFMALGLLSFGQVVVLAQTFGITRQELEERFASERSRFFRLSCLQPPKREVIKAVEDLASSYLALGRDADSERLWLVAVGLREEVASTEADRCALAKALQGLGGVHRLQGRHQQAQQLYKRALKIYEAYGKRHALEMTYVLSDFAYSLEREGKLKEAAALLRRMLGLINDPLQAQLFRDQVESLEKRIKEKI